MSDFYTDVIYLTDEMHEKLFKLWDVCRTNGNYIPADLFFANTIPLRHFLVVLENDTDAHQVTRYHVLPEDDKNILDDGSKLVMTVEVGVSDWQKSCAYVGISIKDGINGLISSKIYVKDLATGQLFEPRVNKEVMDDMHRRINLVMSTWYGIEIAMLHPTVKEIFQHPKIKKERISKAERKDNDNKVYRYVRHHYIKTDELETAIYGKHSINRKALIWYVTGHWREYRKTGKNIFIQPYWKGALRETKQAKPRNREIILEEG